jgi:hypothetical protein
MASLDNCTNPQYIAIPDAGWNETFNKAGATPTTAFLAYTTTGVLPATDGAYVGGICIQDTLGAEKVFAGAVAGYFPMRVKPGVVIAQDAEVAAGTTGEAIVATAPMAKVGRARSAVDGTGTALKPQFILVKLY